MNTGEEVFWNSSAAPEGHGRQFDAYWSECDHFRIDDDEEEDDRATHQNPEEQDADWLREVGLDFVLDDVLGSSGGTHHHQHNDGSAPPVAPPPAARSYVRTLSREQAAAVQRRLDTVTLRRRKHHARQDVRNVFDPAAHQNAGDAADGRRGEMRLSTAAPPSGRAPPGPLWKNHWNQYDAIATPDVKGVAVLGFKMKGTLRGPPAEAAILTPPDEEDEDESPVAVQPGVDWTLQPGFNDSFSLDSQDQELPLVTLCEQPAGVTVPSHLSPADWRKVRSLALIELTALFDRLGITYARRKNTRRKTKESPLYGVPLTTLLEQDNARHAPVQHKVPLIIREILDHLRRHALQEEGILRVSGSALKIDALRSELESCYNGSRNPEQIGAVLSRYGVHEVAGLLKQLLRNLPEPLLTNKYAEAFLHVEGIPTLLEQIKALNLLVLLLPEANRSTLLALVNFLADVTERDGRNRMSVQNVAMIIAPNLFAPKRRKATEENLRVARAATNVTRMLIWYQQLLWIVPSQFMGQIRLEYRLHYEKKHAKENKKKRNQRKDRASWFEPRDNEDTVFRVRVDHEGPTGTTHQVALNDATTAGSVVGEVFLAMHFEARKRDIATGKGSPHGRSSEQHSGDSRFASDVNTFLQYHWLYEVGGYIGWRQLEHNTNVTAVRAENPVAEWVVRCHHIR
uniref:Putative rho gtpase-activating protein 18 n=1 Tax=Rhipicephalus pulchellus TaxID=72859 RepID=L7LZ36_RHIPC